MAKKIKLIIMDVDGVLTNGTVFYSSTGESIKLFCVRDGFFIKHVGPEAGLDFAIITGGFGEIVRTRAEVLGIDKIYAGHVDKESAYYEIKNSMDLEDEEIAYIGDDWFDWSAMQHAGLKAAPSDADPEILKRVDFVTKAVGGKGAVREFIYYILKRDNKLDTVKDRYLD
ncbi:MAG: HAD hydrolase family protein [Candidatus Delongbacteria bacterium]|nr:HAD hydrolase family protein [Candidatus Delongbacteria bacterium]